MDAASHDRFDEFAVGHVLGGLDPVDAAEFRSHLIGCRVCRLRVAELRDLASELAAAAREERAAARVKTEVREDEPAEPDQTEERGQRLSRFVPIIAVAAALVLAGAFWLFQVRDQNATLLSATEQRETTLAMLAEAEPADAALAPGVTGIVVSDQSRIAFTLSGVPSLLPDGHVLAVWLVDGGDSVVARLVAGEIPEGRLALSTDREGASELVITVQPTSSLDAPAGRELVRAQLAGGIDTEDSP